MSVWIVKPHKHPEALIVAATRDQAYTRATALYGWITSTRPLRGLQNNRQQQGGQP